MQRTPKFDAARKAKFLELLAKGIRRSHAAVKVGISRATYLAHMEKYPKFAEDVLQAEMDSHELVEQALFNSALKGNVTAQLAYLQNRLPDRWQDKRNFVVAGDKDNPINIRGKIDVSIDSILTEYYGQENGSGEDTPADDIPEPIHPAQADEKAV